MSNYDEYLEYLKFQTQVTETVISNMIAEERDKHLKEIDVKTRQNNELWTKIDTQRRQNDELLKETSAQMRQNNELRTEIDAQMKQNNELRTEIDAQMRQNNELRTEIDTQKQQNDELLKEILTLDFIDPRDGKIYKTVKIGNQIWMAENLNYECRGSKIYDNALVPAEKYGRLYDWKTAKKACPPGWHLPSEAEWGMLIAATGGKKAGRHLKAKFGWDDDKGKSGNGLDTYGFAALPGGGYGYTGGSNGPSPGFSYGGIVGKWWNSSEFRTIIIWYHHDEVDSCYEGSKFFFSVRCVKD